MSFDINVLRQNINRLCQEHNVTRNCLAESIDIRQSTLSSILNGRSNNPTIEVLVRIADFFNISVDALISRPVPSSGEEAVALEQPAI